MSYFMEPMNNLRKPAHRRVFMRFEAQRGWRITFLEEDCLTALPCKLTFATAEKIMEMYERWGERRMVEDRCAVEHGITRGRGAFWLKLTVEQYAKLKG